MKFSVIVIALVFVGLTSCGKYRVKPSSNITTETHDVSGFDQVEISDAIQAEIEFTSGTEGVVVEANSNVHKYIRVRTINNRLVIDLERNVHFKDEPTIEVKISAISLERVEASGASNVSLLDTCTSSYFDVKLSGASNFKGTLTTGNLDIDLSGASNCNLLGTATSANMELSGASNFGTLNFEMEDLILSMSGASKTTCTVNGTVSVKASGASSLLFSGNATIVKEDLSGASTVERL